MLSLAVALALAQSGGDVRAPVAVVLTSKRPGAEAVSQKIAGRVFDVLKKEQVGGLMNSAQSAKELKAAGYSDPRTCQGTRSCLTKLAILLGAHAVVIGVDVGKVGKTLAIHLEAIAADQEQPLASLDVSSSLDGWSDAMSAPIVVFVRDVKSGLVLKRETPPVPPPPPPPVVLKKPVEDSKPPSDAPKKAELTPAPKEEPLEVRAVAPTAKSHTAAWVLAGSSAAAAGGAVVLGVLGGSDKAKYQASLVTLPDGSMGSMLPENEAKALAASANTKIGLAIGSAVLSAALGGTATWLFLKD
ncbi:MAG: hypothetical protein AB1938_20200 [Myxococcota bacterium]